MGRGLRFWLHPKFTLGKRGLSFIFFHNHCLLSSKVFAEIPLRVLSFTFGLSACLLNAGDIAPQCGGCPFPFQGVGGCHDCHQFGGDTCGASSPKGWLMARLSPELPSPSLQGQHTIWHWPGQPPSSGSVALQALPLRPGKWVSLGHTMVSHPPTIAITITVTTHIIAIPPPIFLPLFYADFPFPADY